jgi:hypothetical protein
LPATTIGHSLGDIDEAVRYAAYLAEEETIALSPAESAGVRD